MISLDSTIKTYKTINNITKERYCGSMISLNQYLATIIYKQTLKEKSTILHQKKNIVSIVLIILEKFLRQK